MRKLNSLIAIVMFLVALVPYTGIQEVEAAQKNVCEKTVDNNYCVESEDVSFSEYTNNGQNGCVEGRLRTGQTLANLKNEAGGACQIGTCIPQDGGQCLDKKTRIECEAQGGTFVDSPIEEVPQCQLGCCKTNSQCAIKESNYCSWEDGTFFSGISGASECNLQCAGQLVGCFKPDNSPNCEYNVQEEFTSRDGQFYSGQFCRDVVGCKTYNDPESETYISIGNGITNDDQKNCYTFDSEGNREGLAENGLCSADSRCVDPDGRGVDTADASCVSTSCITPENGAGYYPSEFRSGESLCVNVLSGNFANDRISKALDNYKLVCANGDIEAVYREDNYRDYKCLEYVDANNENRITGDFVKNEWEQCGNCGEGGALGSKGDVLGYVPILGQLAISAFGNACGDGSSYPPGYDDCSSLGDCGAGPLGTKDYDADFLWSPIGSCNPEYPPGEGSANYGDAGSRCGECGKGGDGVSNVCTKAECNALGDCEFEGGNRAARYGTSGALAIGTMGGALVGCSLASLFPGVDLACRSAVASAFLGLGTKEVLFWGAMSTIYGAGAAAQTTGEENPSQVAKELRTADGTPRLISNLIVARSIGDIISAENNLNFRDDSAADVWLLQATGPTALASLIASGSISGWPGFVSGWSSNSVNWAYADGVGIPTLPRLELLNNVLAAAGIGVSYVTLAESFETGSCVPETGYGNSDHCGECGPGEGQWYCTIERCAAIGGGSVTADREINGGYCQYVPFEEGTKDDGYCIKADPNDRNAPFVKDITVKFQDEDNNTIGQVYTATGKKLEIGGEISQDAVKVDINLTMDDLTASCGISRTSNTAYSEADTNVFDYNARTPNQHAVIELNDDDRVKGDTAEKVHYYIKCKDFLGNTIGTNDDSNYISFTMEERPDLFPPQINYVDPVRTTFPANTTNVNLNLIAYDNNRVVECKYSSDCEVNPDTLQVECNNDYESMTTLQSKPDTACRDIDATCQRFGQTITLTPEMKQTISLGTGDVIPGYESISGENAPNLDVYMLGFKCKDGATNPNINDLVYPWSIIVVPGFSIDIQEPEEGQQVWNETVDFKVLTSSPTTCKIKLNGAEQNLTTLYSYEHVSTLTDLEGSQNGKNYDLEVTCQDIGQNEVTENTNFVVYSDERPPTLLRLWTSSNTLNILLDEKSTCYYSTEDNDFDISQEGISKMATKSGSDGKTHYTTINSDTYYIACEDIWNNVARYTIHP